MIKALIIKPDILLSSYLISLCPLPFLPSLHFYLSIHLIPTSSIFSLRIALLPFKLPLSPIIFWCTHLAINVLKSMKHFTVYTDVKDN